jgi:circadian clock protein KaiB
MSRAPKAGRNRSKAKPHHYLLRLFVVGDGHNSKLADSNLRSLCREHLNGRCTIETIDVEKDFAAAATNNILITPTLIMVAPVPKVVILGNLSDRPKVLLALRLLDGVS